ncbi:type VI secretion system protein ImpF [Azospirillum fermentarium]|uniref:type VI secretion system baseplate subunit TssE n=1 Tax=Azospirillum fermentarium TaxID=1233114 RepID=UPI0022278CC5|nr:type VI secretion system baseplate subunit TssE [Azospirillum fermentarium]MCW2249416.1 type VI secretion system protein ImpF [Azospirillum fermentarium]
MAQSRSGSSRSGHAHSGRALLFERLVDDEPLRTAEPSPFRAVDLQGMRESIARELSWLLNTRAPIPPGAAPRPFRSTIDYGGPDVARSGDRSREGLLGIAGDITDAVSAFEPRLTSVMVSVDWETLRNRKVTMEISALMVTGGVPVPVTFPVHLGGDGDAEVEHGW